MAKLGVVCGITSRATLSEVVVRVCGEQCLVAMIDSALLRLWGIAVGEAVVVDDAAPSVRIHPRQPRTA